MSTKPTTVALLAALAAPLLISSPALAQSDRDVIEKFSQQDKFRQLEEILPTPNDQRTASGAPGQDYWQQPADALRDVELDEEHPRIIGPERRA